MILPVDIDVGLFINQNGHSVHVTLITGPHKGGPSPLKKEKKSISKSVSVEDPEYKSFYRHEKWIREY
jgi:hypothetical protein